MPTEELIAEIESKLTWDDTGLPIGVWRPAPAAIVTPVSMGREIPWIYVLYARGDLAKGPKTRRNLQAGCVIDLNEQQLFFQIPEMTRTGLLSPCSRWGQLGIRRCILLLQQWRWQTEHQAS